MVAGRGWRGGYRSRRNAGRRLRVGVKGVGARKEGTRPADCREIGSRSTLAVDFTSDEVFGDLTGREK